MTEKKSKRKTKQEINDFKIIVFLNDTINLEHNYKGKINCLNPKELIYSMS